LAGFALQIIVTWTLVMFDALFREAGPNILGNQRIIALDIGGAAGLQPHWTRFLGNSTLVMFEPHEQSFAELQALCARTPDAKAYRLVKTALSGTGGIRTFYATNVPTGSSICPINPNSPYVSPDNSYFFPVKEIAIRTATLRDSLDQEGIDRVDAMKLDIQGAELEVILSLDDKRMSEVLLIESEVGLADIYLNATTFRDIERELTARGFELFDARTNRTERVLQNSSTTYRERYFGVTAPTASISSRLYELDTVFFRHPRPFLERKDGFAIRRLVFCYCVYLYFAEAVYLLEESVKAEALSEDEANGVLSIVVALQRAVRQELQAVDQRLAASDRMVWAQYTWTPYPCA
jgi:FkbM family methyltransferase